MLHVRPRAAHSLLFFALSTFASGLAAAEHHAETIVPPTPPPEVKNVVTHVGAATSVYRDTDQVGLVTPAVSAEVGQSDSSWSARVTYLADIISGASVDIVSTASQPEPGIARWNEVRHAATVEGNYEFLRSFAIDENIAFSGEPDRLFFGAMACLIWNVVRDRWSVYLGYGGGHDIIGLAQQSFRTFSRNVDHQAIPFGATFSPNPFLKFRLSADIVLVHGDASNPYRRVPLFRLDDASNIPKGASLEAVTARDSAVSTESLPPSRARYAITLAADGRVGTGTVGVAERLYTDSWSLSASTTQLAYLLDVSRRWTVEPLFRFHAQSGADFWRRAYVMSGNTLPRFRSGDRELGPLWTVSAGTVTAFGIGPENRPYMWTLSLEGDVMQTRFLDHLYVTSRTAGLVTLGALAAFE